MHYIFFKKILLGIHTVLIQKIKVPTSRERESGTVFTGKVSRSSSVLQINEIAFGAK